MSNLLSSEKALEASVAIGLVALLFERAFLQLLEAIRADEMFRMKFLEHGSNAATCRQQIQVVRSKEFSYQDKGRMRLKGTTSRRVSFSLFFILNLSA